MDRSETKSRQDSRPDDGFSLIELLVVIVILGLIASVVAVNVTGVLGESKQKVAEIQISALKSALKHYHLDNGVYPTTEQGLEALVAPPETDPVPRKWRQGGYLDEERVPLDPWDNPYRYLSPGTNNSDYDLWSTGSDGEDGGEGEAADVTSWGENRN